MLVHDKEKDEVYLSLQDTTKDGHTEEHKGKTYHCVYSYEDTETGHYYMCCSGVDQLFKIKTDKRTIRRKSGGIFGAYTQQVYNAPSEIELVLSKRKTKDSYLVGLDKHGNVTVDGYTNHQIEETYAGVVEMGLTLGYKYLSCRY